MGVLGISMVSRFWVLAAMLLRVALSGMWNCVVGIIVLSF
jgi:hypothetical protein